MPVYTYVGNINPSEKTTSLTLRNGALVVHLGEHADFLPEEYILLRHRYKLVPGSDGGSAGEPSKTPIRLADLLDVDVNDISDGQTMVYDESTFRWIPGSGEEMPVVTHGDDPDAERPPLTTVLWVGSIQPAQAVDGDIWINTI